jgi:adenine phosphoribosyltransferase
MMSFKSLIRTVPDFPKAGIRFRDITPLLASEIGLRHVIDLLAERYRGKVDKVVGIEARGFIFGAALACQINAGFVPIRKPGKLPGQLYRHDYDLEYGSNSLNVHVDGMARGERALVIDDLLATGGTALAALALLGKIGASVVECAFVIELSDLPGRKRLEERGAAVHALCQFSESE